MMTNKQYNSKSGPKLGQLPNFGGKQEDFKWSFDDGIHSSDISDFSEENKSQENGGASLSDVDYVAPVRPVSKNSRKTGKKSKKKNTKKATKKKNIPNFYNVSNTHTISSMAPDASKVATPKFKKGRGVKKNQSISPRGYSSKNYTSNSANNEGGSRISPTHVRNSSSKEFWKYDPVSIGKAKYMKSSRKSRANYKSQKRSQKSSNFGPLNRNNSRNLHSLSPEASYSPNHGYRDCIISPRAQDIDYNAKDADNSAFNREYAPKVTPYTEISKIPFSHPLEDLSFGTAKRRNKTKN